MVIQTLSKYLYFGMGKGFSCVGKRLPGFRQKRHAQDGLRVPQGEGACRAVEGKSGEDLAEVVAGALLVIDQKLADREGDLLAGLNVHAVVGIGDDAQLLAAA